MEVLRRFVNVYCHHQYYSVSCMYNVMMLQYNYCTVRVYAVCRYVTSWIEKREVQSEKANLTILFERYIPILIEANKTGRFKKITPVQEV